MSPTLRARIFVLTAALLFSTGGAAIKATALTGWQVACLRSAVAGLTVLLLMPGARRRPSLPVVAVGAVYAVTMVGFVLSNKLTTSANAIFLQSTAPLYLLLLGPWLLAEPVRRRDVGFMVALAAGLALFFVGVEPARTTAPNPMLGNLVAVGTGVFWALTVAGLRWIGRRHHHAGGDEGAQAVLAGNVLAAVGCLPAALPLGTIATADVGLIAYLGIVQIGLAYLFLTRGMRNVTALEASLLMLLEPVLNPVWSWLVHGEKPGGFAIAGGAVILATTLTRTWVESRSPVAAA